MRAPWRADCRTCGACCIGGFDDGAGFADVSVDDVKRMSRHARARLLTERTFRSETRMTTPGVMSEEFGKSCGFLRGTPGRRVSCGIYETRPKVCQRFTPGGKGCREAREAMGL